MKRAICLSLLALAGTLGCGVQFEDQSRIATLRVLGVRKDKPYAKPGDTVKLSMLYDDGSIANADAAVKPRPVNVLWIAKCKNPEGDVYLGCFEQLAKAFEGIVSGNPGADGGSASGLDYGPGHVEFSFKLDADIIKRHAPPSDKSPRYGLEFVFFILCAGDVRPAPAGQQFPLACYSKSGAQLGADDFVVGYSAVYAYESITNANPIVTGFKVDGKDITPECIDDACIREEELGTGSVPRDAGPADASGRDAGTEGGAPEAGAPPASDGGSPGGAPVSDPCQNPKSPFCFDVCTAEKQADCPEHDVKVETDPHTLEPDTVSLARDGEHISEQAWINYYTDLGKFDVDTKLLGDATNGYQEDHGTKVRVPQKVGPFHVWGVAHDNRGGVSWVKVELGTRAEK